MLANRTMKNSGIEWIGEIPEDWNIAPIGHLYSERKQKVSDTVYKPLSVTKQGVVPQLDSAAKSDAHDDRKLVCIGDFAINSRSDRRGSCGISDYEGSISLINTVLTPKAKIIPKYFDWLFHTTMFADEFYKWGHGIVADLWTTNWSDMKKIMVTLPPQLEQQKIADFLDEKCKHIDAVLEKTRASIDEYKQLKQSVITKAVTKGIRPNRPMKNSGIEWIGEIPEDWETIKLKSGVDYNTDTLAENTETDYEFDYIEIGSVEFGKGIVGTERLKFKDAPSRARRIVNKDDVVLSTVRTYLRAIAQVPENNIQMVASTGFIVLTAKETKITPEFLYYSILSNNFISLVEANSVGISYPAINSSVLINYKITHPSINEQVEIANYLNDKCSGIDKLITKKEQLIEELETYKKSLIYEYVTGKKEVC